MSCLFGGWELIICQGAIQGKPSVLRSWLPFDVGFLHFLFQPESPLLAGGFKSGSRRIASKFHARMEANSMACLCRPSRWGRCVFPCSCAQSELTLSSFRSVSCWPVCSHDLKVCVFRFVLRLLFDIHMQRLPAFVSRTHHFAGG